MSIPFKLTNLVIDPNNLPSWIPYISNQSLDIKYLSLDDFHYEIKKALSKCLSITKLEWDDEFKMYKIEYGTRPLEYEHIESALTIQKMRLLSIRVAFEALRRFPHNDDEYVDILDIPMPLYFTDLPRRWSRFEIRLCWNHQVNCLHVYSQRLTGDRSSYFHVWKLVKEHFIEITPTGKKNETNFL